MKNKLLLRLVIFAILLSLGNFQITFAATPFTGPLLVKCTGPSSANSLGTSYAECNFDDFVNQVNTVINFLLYISVLLATISFIYCGFLFLTAGGDTGKAKKAKEIALKVVIGFFWIFAAWLIVHFITSAFGLLPGASLIENQ